MERTRPHGFGVLFSLSLIVGVMAIAWSVPVGRASAQETPEPFVSTDRKDYVPGEVVTITGANFQPGEIVTIAVQSTGRADRFVTSVADPSGGFTNTDFLPDESDRHNFIKIVATGGVSGPNLTAVNYFFDATPPGPCPYTVDASLAASDPANSKFKTIQEAVTALPNPGPCTINIKAGPAGTTYSEFVVIGTVNSLAASSAKEITIQPDPGNVGVVTVTAPGLGSNGTTSHAFSLTSSKFLTITGLTLSGSARSAIRLRGDVSPRNSDITIEGNTVVNNNAAGTVGVNAIDIGQGHVRVWIVNNLIRNNGRHGIGVDDGAAGSGPNYIVNNTISGNAWGGLSRTGGATVSLVNNLIVGNGTIDTGAANCSCGLAQVNSGTAAGITLKNNMFYRNGNTTNGFTDIQVPSNVLDATDSGNYVTCTGTGTGCTITTLGGIAGCTFSDCLTTHIAATEIFKSASDFHLKSDVPRSPAIDKGTDSFQNPVGTEWVPAIDFENDTRPVDGDGVGGATTDIGYDEAPPATGILIVKKHVVNDNGGTKAAAQFTVHVKSDGTDVEGSPAAGSEDGTSYTLLPGTYVVSEDATPTGYALSFSGACGETGGVTVVAGETKTCTVTNDDIQPKLIVIKHVINDNGGTATAGSFTMTVTGSSPTPASFAGAESPGTTVRLNVGSYSVDETGPTGYAKSASADCSGSIAIGETKTCTVTNDDIQPKLIVIKHVINDNGGTETAGSFTMTVTGSSPSPSSFAGAESPGTTVGLNAGSYSVDETGPSGYAKSASDDCSGSIAIGETKTCTVTNDDVLLDPAKLWIGLKIVDDQGTQFDVQVRVYHSLSDPADQPIATGLTRCITGVVRAASLAKQISVPFDKAASRPYAIRIFTRIGTNADDTKCSGPGGSHNNAQGLRLYYDATSRASGFASPFLYMHTNSSDILNTTPPSGDTAKFKDSAGVNFAGGNAWKEIGTGWTEP